jgi:hypothetical protein
MSECQFQRSGLHLTVSNKGGEEEVGRPSGKISEWQEHVASSISAKESHCQTQHRQQGHAWMPAQHKQQQQGPQLAGRPARSSYKSLRRRLSPNKQPEKRQHSCGQDTEQSRSTGPQYRTLSSPPPVPGTLVAVAPPPLSGSQPCSRLARHCGGIVRQGW